MRVTVLVNIWLPFQDYDWRSIFVEVVRKLFLFFVCCTLNTKYINTCICNKPGNYFWPEFEQEAVRFTADLASWKQEIHAGFPHIKQYWNILANGQNSNSEYFHKTVHTEQLRFYSAFARYFFSITWLTYWEQYCFKITCLNSDHEYLYIIKLVLNALLYFFAINMISIYTCIIWWQNRIDR